MDSNRGSLVLEATALPTEPHPLPLLRQFYNGKASFAVLLVLGR